MEERKKARLRLPRLSRGWRIVRNIGAALVVLSLAWAQLLFPLGDAERNFRRMERVNLLVPSEVVFQSDGPRPALVGLRDGWALVGRHLGGTLGDWNVCRYPMEEGVTVLPLGEILRYGGGTITSGQGLLAFGLPEEAGMIHGVLDLSREGWEGTAFVRGELQESGAWLFFFQWPEDMPESGRAQQELGSGCWSVPCTLRVYGPGLDLLEVEEIRVNTALSEEELARRQ